MAASNYDQCLRWLLLHEGGYTNHPSDPGGPTKFGITIVDYRKYVKPGATATDVKAMTLAEAMSIYRAKYWDAQRCDELPPGIDYAVFDYGVNSGIARSGKVLRRCLKLVDNTNAVSDAVIAAAAAADAKVLAAAICDERLRFLQRLKTWDVFGKGWGRRVADVRAISLRLAAHEPVAMPTPVSRPIGRGIVSVNKTAQQGSAGAIAAAGTAAAQQAHASGAQEWAVAVIAAAALAFAICGWLFWRRRQQRQQQKPA